MPGRRIPKDPYAPVVDLPHAEIEYLKISRKVLLAPIEVRTGNKVRKDTRLNLYARRIVEDATAKRGASVKHHRQLRDIGALKPHGLAARPITSLTPNIERQDRICASTYDSFWPTFLALLPYFKKEYGAVYGDLGDITKVLPLYMLSTPSFADSMKRIRKMHRKRAKGQSFKVGHKKPSVDKQYVKGQSGNMRGRPKTKTFFETLEASFHKKITVRKADGTSKRVSQGEAGITQLFNDAMYGNSRARTEINRLIKALHLAGMLKPEPRTSPLRKPTDEGKALAAVRLSIMVGVVKRFLSHRFEKTYGPVPAFTTLLERNTSDLNDIPGLDALIEKHPRLGTAIDGIKAMLMREEKSSREDVETFDDAEAVSDSGLGHDFESESKFDDATPKANANEAVKIAESPFYPVPMSRPRLRAVPKGKYPPVATIPTKGKKGKKEPGDA